jgi:hypothetical protein
MKTIQNIHQNYNVALTLIRQWADMLLCDANRFSFSYEPKQGSTLYGYGYNIS